MAYKDSISTEIQDIRGLSNQTTEIQQLAANIFEAQGIPSTKDEEWKFTNLTKLFSKDFGQNKSQKLAQNPNFTSFEKYSVVFENGNLDIERSSLLHENGLEISDLKQKLQDSDFVQNTFNKAFATDLDPMLNLNTALLQGGIYIKIAKNKTIDKPIVLEQLMDANSTNQVTYTRFIIELEENAEATFINSNKSTGTLATLSNFVAEIHVGKNARLKYYTLQKDHSESSQLNNIKIIQEANSVIDTVTISLDGDLVRNNLNIILNGEHIESNFASLYLIKGKTHVDNHTVADHKFPNCNSNELYKGIMDERARGVFNGKIFVRQDAQKTNAFQANNNILLSDDAIINTKPQLEIWADDVKCSHGCTVGQLDKEALFYLQARGIGQQKAKALLLESFALEVVDKIAFEPLATYTRGLISTRFGNE